MKFSICALAFLAVAANAGERRRNNRRPDKRPNGGGAATGATSPEFTDLGCANAAGLPACTDRRGNAGVWVCSNRPRFNSETKKTLCVSPERTIAEYDTCGICEDGAAPEPAVCPESCACELIVEGTEEGSAATTTAGINIEITRFGGRTKTKCVSTERATAVLAGGFGSCCSS